MVNSNYYGIKNWDAFFTNPQFEFYFKVLIPKARKEREIIMRDRMGRILASRVPEIPIYYNKLKIN